MVGYFIAGTGTGVGKTLVTASLVWQLRAAGREASAIKPVITGFDPNRWHDSDTAMLLGSMNLPLTLENAAAISPWRLPDPLSPHMASARQNRKIFPADVEDFCRQAMAREGVMLIEGAGGVWVPLTLQYSLLDLMMALKLPVILVAGSYVGSISHTMTAVESLERRKLRLQGIIISESERKTAPPLQEVAETITTLVRGAAPVFTLPRMPAKTALWKYSPPLTEVFDHGKSKK